MEALKSYHKLKPLSELVICFEINQTFFRGCVTTHEQLPLYKRGLKSTKPRAKLLRKKLTKVFWICVEHSF